LQRDPYPNDGDGDGDGQRRNPATLSTSQRCGERLPPIPFSEEFLLTASLADRAVDSRVLEFEAEATWDIDKLAALAASKGED